MWEDPIVAEVRRIREELAAKYNFDVQAIFANLRHRQAALGGRLVSPIKPGEPAKDADRGLPLPVSDPTTTSPHK